MAGVVFWYETEVFKVPDCKKCLPFCPQRLPLPEFQSFHGPLQQRSTVNLHAVNSGHKILPKEYAGAGDWPLL